MAIIKPPPHSHWLWRAPPQTLKVIKHVVNDNGGTATAGNWNLAVSSSNGGAGTGSAPGVALNYRLSTCRDLCRVSRKEAHSIT
jgi:hypothetical protein